VRGILYMSSLWAIRWDPDLKKLYHRFRKEKGMNHYQAMRVVMYNLLRMIYGVLKNQTPYDRQVDRKNRREQTKNGRSTRKSCSEQNSSKDNPATVHEPGSRLNRRCSNQPQSLQKKKTGGLPVFTGGRMYGLTSCEHPKKGTYRKHIKIVLK